jgi:hypothetical protein
MLALNWEGPLQKAPNGRRLFGISPHHCAVFKLKKYANIVVEVTELDQQLTRQTRRGLGVV